MFRVNTDYMHELMFDLLLDSANSGSECDLVFDSIGLEFAQIE